MCLQIDVSYNAIDQAASLQLIAAMKGKSMESIGMASCELGVEGAKSAAELVSVMPSLTELSISGNSIGNDGKYAIGAAVGSSMQRLVCDQLDLRADATELNLRQKRLGPGDAALIAGGLRAFMGSLTKVR